MIIFSRAVRAIFRILSYPLPIGQVNLLDFIFFAPCCAKMYSSGRSTRYFRSISRRAALICPPRWQSCPGVSKPDAKTTGQRRGNIGKAAPRTEIHRSDTAATDYERHILARVVGGFGESRVAAVVGRNHQDVILAHPRQKAAEKPVKPPASARAYPSCRDGGRSFESKSTRFAAEARATAALANLDYPHPVCIAPAG